MILFRSETGGIYMHKHTHLNVAEECISTCKLIYTCRNTQMDAYTHRHTHVNTADISPP